MSAYSSSTIIKYLSIHIKDVMMKKIAQYDINPSITTIRSSTTTELKWWYHVPGFPYGCHFNGSTTMAWAPSHPTWLSEENRDRVRRRNRIPVRLEQVSQLWTFITVEAGESGDLQYQVDIICWWRLALRQDRLGLLDILRFKDVHRDQIFGSFLMDTWHILIILKLMFRNYCAIDIENGGNGLKI